jgi:hypothetical protein
MKKFNRIFLYVSVLLFAAGGAYTYFIDNIDKYVYPTLIPPESVYVDHSKPLRQQTRIVEIDGKRYKIPLMYFDTKLRRGVKQESILLEVVWPEMTSTQEIRTKQEYDRIWKQERRVGWILVSEIGRKLNLDQMLAVRRKRAAKIEGGSGGYALNSEIHYLPSPEGAYLYKEYFYKEENGKIVDFIECSIKHGYTVTPRCSIRFYYNNLYFEVSFNRENFLPQWQQQRQRAIKFLESFSISLE